MGETNPQRVERQSPEDALRDGATDAPEEKQLDELPVPEVWLRVPKLPGAEGARVTGEAESARRRNPMASTSTLVGLAGVALFTAILYWMLPGRSTPQRQPLDRRAPPIWQEQPRPFHDQAFEPAWPSDMERHEAADLPVPDDVGARPARLPGTAPPAAERDPARVIAELEGTIEPRPTRR